jgi:DNA-directed RNA polymerase specialized sigma24 family protein
MRRPPWEPPVDDDRRRRFEAVYAQTYEPILGYAMRRCDSPEDAADAVAETFAIAWRRVDALPPHAEARLWLYGIARNVLANQRRGLRVAFQIIEPNPDGNGFSMNPAKQSAKVGDRWYVWAAEPEQAGTVRLLVTEKHLPKNPVTGK